MQQSLGLIVCLWVVVGLLTYYAYLHNNIILLYELVLCILARTLASRLAVCILKQKNELVFEELSQPSRENERHKCHLFYRGLGLNIGLRWGGFLKINCVVSTIILLLARVASIHSSSSTSYYVVA